MAANEMQNNESEYVYLDEEVNLPDEDLVVAPAEFFGVWMGQLNDVEVDGVMADRKKFCSEGFPEQNLDHFYMIPLYLNPLYRAAYFAEYSGQGVPPDCLSHNGVTPVTPLSLNGQIIYNCQACPLYGFGKPYKCHTKPSLIGLAYFPQHGDLLVPIRKELPGLSAKAGNALSRQLTTPTQLDETGVTKLLPIWTRIVKVSVVFQENKKYGGKTPTWGFATRNLSTPVDEEMPYKFVPPHMIEHVKKFIGIAKAFKAQQGLPQLGSSGPLPAIGAAAQPPGLPAAPPIATPSQTVVTAEESSDY